MKVRAHPSCCQEIDFWVDEMNGFLRDRRDKKSPKAKSREGTKQKFMVLKKKNAAHGKVFSLYSLLCSYDYSLPELGWWP